MVCHGGHRFGNFMPHLTYAELNTDAGTGINRAQTTWTAGIRYELSPNSAIKFEWANIERDHGSAGLFVQEFDFSTMPPTPIPFDFDDADMFSIAIDIIF